MLKKNFILYLLSGIVLIAGCEKKDVYKGSDGEKNKDSFFNYAMNQEVTFSLGYEVPEGFQVYFEAYTENPVSVDAYGNYVKKEGLTPFLSGYTDKKGYCNLPVQLPKVVSDVFVYSPVAGVPVLLKGKNENGKIEITQNALAGSKALSSKAQNYWTQWDVQNVQFIHSPKFDQNGTPELVNPGLTINEETMGIIDATIPQGKELNLIMAQQESIALAEDAGVKLYYVDDNSARKNVLAYYTYTGDEKQLSQHDVNQKLILLYPNLTRQALKTGDGVELQYFDGENWTKVFPKGTKIGFALLVDAWDAEQATVKTSGIHVIYSSRNFNNYRFPNAVKAERPHMAMFRAGEDVILSFEDQPYTEYDVSPYFGEFRDNIFIIKTDPATALPDDIIDGQNPTEPDGMLCVSTSGILAFEDNWPYEGDYDMNDVVVAYKSSVYIEDMTDITGVADTFTFLHAGAKYVNGFGYVLPTERTNIDKIVPDFGYECQGQGIDNELEEATIMLFDDGGKVKPGTKFAVKVWYKQPVGYSFNQKVHRNAPYNPFIVVRGAQETTDWLDQDRREIHLVRDYAPTPKAKAALFHTGSDLSDPEAGFYYVSKNNYPFGINVPDIEHFQYPETESMRIDALYPDFSSWAKSFGEKNKDWYLKPVAQ